MPQKSAHKDSSVLAHRCAGTQMRWHTHTVHTCMYFRKQKIVLYSNVVFMKVAVGQIINNLDDSAFEVPNGGFSHYTYMYPPLHGEE